MITRFLLPPTMTLLCFSKTPGLRPFKQRQDDQFSTPIESLMMNLIGRIVIAF